jgi:PAS domain S-box-containing protein
MFIIALFTNLYIMYIVIIVLCSFIVFLLFQLLILKRRLKESQEEARDEISRIKLEMDENCRKITGELKQLYEESQENETQLKETIESAMQGIAILSLEGQFQKINSAVCDIIGYTEAELLRTDLQCITHPDDYSYDLVNIKSLIQDNIPFYKLEKRLYHVAGITVWVMQYMRLIKGADDEPLHFVAHFIDITERKQAEDQLKKYTETLTVLLREVNHRVKNNLAALISMLHMEQNKARVTQNDGYIEFLNDLISRIQSLSTVHSMLSAQNWQPLELNQLCNQVIQAAISGTPPGKKVQIQITKTKIKVNSNQAHHLTLVINELTTNSIKHAIHDRDQAEISVDITNDDENIQIRFKDDGPGFPQALIDGDFSRANIGFELIRGIVLQSLDGEFYLENNNGATAIIKFQNELEIK